METERSELRRAELSLRESEARFQVLFEQAAVGVAIIQTATGRFQRVNRKYTSIVGYNQDELLELDFMRITLPEDLEPDLAQMERLKRGEIGEFTLEKRLLAKGGRVVWVELTVSPMWAPGEEPTHHIAVVRDIGARKDAERLSRQHRDDLESTLAALPDLLFDIDDEGRIYDFRAPRLDSLAVPPDQFLGRTAAEVLPPDAASAIRAAIDEALKHGRASGFRYALEMEGGRRWFELSVAQKKSGTSERPRLIAIAREVTERVAAEAQRESLEAQLRQSQKMEALGTLAGGIAHDFNNLLAVIGLNASLARRLAESTGQHDECLDAVLEAVTRGESLVQQILAFGRRQSVARTHTSISQVVSEATRLLRATIPAHVAIEVELPNEELGAVLNHTQLQQVVINLGTNAWQALHGRRGTVRFSLERIELASPDDGARRPHARLRVSDDGVGIPAEILDRIFEPFFTTRGAGGGTGLGLSVVHGIVSENGWTIRVDSAPGVGTTFELSIALAPDEARAPEPRSVASIAGAGRHVMYVDDEPYLLRPVRRMLEHLDFRCSVFSDPVEALAAYRAQPGDWALVISDYSMPGLTGLELAEQMNDVAPVPVVLVSGFAPLGPDELEKRGVLGRLPKPFDVDVLQRALVAVLAR